jgi:sulfur carrier protein
MDVRVNGEIRRLAEGTTIIQLLDEMGLAGRRVAVEVNREIIPGSMHAEYTLQAEDQVEVVQAIGGG